VFECDLDPAISANPYFEFNAKALAVQRDLRVYMAR